MVISLYVVNGLLIGWTNTYNVALGVETPDMTRHPAIAWLLSVTGWLVVPAVIGTIAAALVLATYDSYRKRTLPEALKRWKQR